MIWSCLQGCMGQAWADNAAAPHSAQILSADFCFFAGEPNAELLRNRQGKEFLIFIPQNDAWAALLESIYANHCKRVTRYAIRKEADVFDRERLRQLTALPDDAYRMQMIDETLYRQALSQEWSRDWCSAFANWEEYRTHGLGVAALYKDQLAAGASSYLYYRGGIEIQVNTAASFRKRGLAAACSARLILECLDRGLYPSWDAQNLMSVGLAEKLGYHFSHSYRAYEVYGEEITAT